MAVGMAVITSYLFRLHLFKEDPTFRILFFYKKSSVPSFLYLVLFIMQLKCGYF
jgi:hypothetical protein